MQKIEQHPIFGRLSMMPIFIRLCESLEKDERTLQSVYEYLSNICPAGVWSPHREFNAYYFWRNHKFPEGAIFGKKKDQPFQGELCCGGICISSGFGGAMVFIDSSFYSLSVYEIYDQERKGNPKKY